MSPSTILFLAANPERIHPLQLGEECRAIENMIQTAKFREQIRFRSRWAARLDDLMQALNEDTPSILHFSGHGTGNEGLYFQSEDGSAFRVSAERLEQVIQAAGASVAVVILNACYSEVQARALATHVPCVIGMSGAIEDEAAISYARSFYRALASGKSVANAHKQGLAALPPIPTSGPTRDLQATETAPCSVIPQLLTRSDVSAENIHIVKQASAKKHCELRIKATLNEFDADVIARVAEKLREITGDFILEITDIHEGSVRLELSLSPLALEKLLQLKADGELNEICGFEVLDVSRLPKDVSRPPQVSTSGRAALERDLYQKLLQLRGGVDPKALVTSILELLVTVTDAQHGYLELWSRDDLQPRWTVSHGCTPDQVEQIRAVTSRGIVAESLASGQTLHVPHSLLDDRFSGQRSVRKQRLEAVMCVPLGSGGVLYLEGRHGGGPFSDDDLRIAENVAVYLWPSVEQLARAEQSRVNDPTQPFRQRLQLEDITGRSAALARVFEQVQAYAPLDVTLLLTGPAGTGKTQLAHTIHANSNRRNGPFVELNCGAIPENLIESELFGTMPGPFSGARRLSGKVEAAEGGTLFLDEIVEIPITTQVKLLQLLQSRQYYPLGSNKIAPANIRLIAATKVDLPAMVSAKRFREDLYYQLNVINLRMPTLSERTEDIRALVDEMLVRVARGHNLPPLPASEQFHRAMRMLEWPGNIRQLRGRIEAALIKANTEAAPQVELRHLSGGQPLPEQPTTFHEATRSFQRDLLCRELLAQNWNVAQVAKRMDLTLAHVYNLIHQFELRREETELASAPDEPDSSLPGSGRTT